MKPLPRWAEGLDWTGWNVYDNGACHEFTDADDCQHSIAIAPSGWFEIVNVDGEIAWSATFPSTERAHRAAVAIIEGMGK